ncbi:MAG: hypothetical protein RLZZ246_2116 [Planctomycetota bacterium]|jgi:hypothetical protein
MDANDPRCASRFSLARLEDAFGICHGGYHGCAIYHRINLEASLRERIGQSAAARILPPGRMPGLMEAHAQGRATKPA